jgi:hypothetical protein
MTSALLEDSARRAIVYFAGIQARLAAMVRVAREVRGVG